MAQPRTARLGLGFIWGVLGFSLVGIIVILFRQGTTPVDEYEKQRAENRLKTRLELEEAAQKKLSEYAWVNKEKGVVAVPINRAMELTVADLQTRKAGDSGEKAVIMPTLLIPAYLKEDTAEAAPAEAEGAATPAEGEAQPTEGEAKPEEGQPAEEAKPTEEPKSTEEGAPAEEGAAAEAPETPTSENESAAPAAPEAAPAATPETPSEP